MLLFLRSLFLLNCLLPALASPSLSPSFHPALLPRLTPIIVNATGKPQVFNPLTQQPIPQSSASDGAGKNFSLPAVIWIAFCFLVGPPLALAGIRGWRFTTGTGIGLAAAVCSWAAVITSESAVGIQDLFLVAVVLVFFSAGFVFGLFRAGRIAGVILLAITGGLSVGIRVVLITKGLVIPFESLFFVNWLVVAILGASGGLVLLRSQRAGITIGAASAGTFLSILGVDLIINRQAGMSRGLRFLFDRNDAHFLDIIQNGYHPPLSTVIGIGTSLALVPILAFFQHKVFPHPFSRLPPSEDELDPVNVDIAPPEKRVTLFAQGLNAFRSKSRFSV